MPEESFGARYVEALHQVNCNDTSKTQQGPDRPGIFYEYPPVSGECSCAITLPTEPVRKLVFYEPIQPGDHFNLVVAGGL